MTTMTSCPLSHRDDSIHLSDLFCLVRSQLEVFVVPPESRTGCRSRQAGGKAMEVGRVGVRCVHCTRAGLVGVGGGGGGDTPPQPQQQASDGGAAGKGAVLFPLSIRLVYQAARNYQRYHFTTCPTMPPDVKDRYTAIKAGKRGKRSAKTAPKYWDDSCRRLGMVDSNGSGIRLREGRFFSEDEWVSEGESESGEGDARGVFSSSDGEAAERDALAAASSLSTIDEADLPGTAAVAPQSWNPPPVKQQQVSQEHHVVAPLDMKRKSNLVTMLERPAGSREPSPMLSLNREASTFPASEMAQAGLSSPLFANEHGLAEPAESCVKDDDLFSNEISEAIGVNECGLPPLVHSFGPKENTLPEHDHLFRAPLPALDEGEPGNTTSSGNCTNDMILERLRLAQSTVQAVAEICHVNPLLDSYDSGQQADHDDDAARAQEKHESDMHYIGEELYELFSGRSVSDSNRFAEEECASQGVGQQHLKRGRCREAKRYIPLGDLGLPVALCNLVSNLLDYSSSTSRPTYKSIEEVEQDLSALASNPEGLLFHVPTGELDVARGVIYGRSEQVSLLHGAYDRAVDAGGSTGSNMVLISGYSGTGKSTLVYHAAERFIERGACFASGKFDAMQQIGLGLGFVSAIDDYCDLLARDDRRRGRVKDALHAAIGGEGMVLANLVPNLQKLVGDVGGRRSLLPSSGREAMYRLMFQLRILFRATCSHEHPVVLFLDDLQWADEMSLELMQALVTDAEIRGLLLVGCYRDNEVDANHPLTTRVESIRRTCSISIVQLCVDNLEEKSINSLVSDALHLRPQITRPLAQAVLSKTGGNALFAVQFCRSLHDEGLLRFSLASKQWEWDIERIQDKEISDSVVALMSAKLLKLSPEVRSALSVAGGFGAQCNEAVLGILDRAPDKRVSTSAALDIAVAEGLMSKAGSLYQFSHDQIQSASYLLVSESERSAFHLKIGRSLCEHSSHEEMNSFLFVVLDQMHRGSSLIVDHKEKIDLSQLSLKAGQMASTMSAFLPASAYFNAGINLLAQDDWNLHRDLCFELHNACAETECILGDFGEMKERVDAVLSRASTLHEKLRPYLTLVQALGSQGRVREAINTALPVISQLGEPFPFIVTESMNKIEIASTKNLLGTKSEEQLVELKEMVDYEKRQAMKYLHLLVLYVYSEKKEYYPIVVCRMMRLSLLHGVCKESAFGFASFGMMLSGLLGDIAGGYRFGKLALNLIDKFQAQEYLAKVFVCVHGFISPWVEPIQSTLPSLKRAIDVGLATGDSEYAMIATGVYAGSALCSGQALVPLLEEVGKFMKQSLQYNQQFSYDLLKPLQQAMLHLTDPSMDPTKLIGEETDATSMLPPGNDSASGQPYQNQVVQCFYRMWLSYVFGDYKQAWAFGDSNRGMKKHSVARFPFVCNHTFYIGLSALVLARKEGKSKYIECIDGSIRQMKVWVASTPWNCGHKLELLNAEKFYLEGNIIEAARSYEKSIDLASKRSFLHEQALALERTGIFYLERGESKNATESFKKAHDCYIRWGARSKAAHVQAQYL